MTHDDDDDDDDDAYQEDGFPQDGYCGDQREPFDNALRFGFSFGPNGMRIDEPPLFGHVLRGMEEIFSHLSRCAVHIYTFRVAKNLMQMSRII